MDWKESGLKLFIMVDAIYHQGRKGRNLKSKSFRVKGPTFVWLSCLIFVGLIGHNDWIWFIGLDWIAYNIVAYAVLQDWIGLTDNLEIKKLDK